MNNLTRNNFDIVMNQWELSTWAYEHGLMSSHLFISSFALVFNASEANSEKRGKKIFSDFLSTDAWLALLAASIFGAVVFGFILAAERNRSVRVEPVAQSWNLVFAIIQMIDPGALQTFSLRLFGFSWCFLWLVMSMMFSSHISSTMTIEKMTQPIGSLQDLSESNREFFWSGYTMQDTHHMIEKLKKRYDIFKSPEMERVEGIDPPVAAELLRRGKILVTYLPSFPGEVSAADREKCEYNIVMDESIPKTMHFLFSKKRRLLLDRFNVHIQGLKETGRLLKWQQKWTGNICNNDNKTTSASVKWEDVVHVFIVAGTGMFLAGIIALIKKLAFGEQSQVHS